MVSQFGNKLFDPITTYDGNGAAFLYKNYKTDGL
jgi:hypothetical protein